MNFYEQQRSAMRYRMIWFTLLTAFLLLLSLFSLCWGDFWISPRQIFECLLWKCFSILPTVGFGEIVQSAESLEFAKSAVMRNMGNESAGGNVALKNAALNIAQIEEWILILREFRLPRLGAAILGGAALAVSGLTMQSVFRNPLAGPFVLGVSSGATLGVALVSIAGFSFGVLGILPAAAFGALLVIAVVFACSEFLKSSVAVLIVGLMIAYLCDAIVSFLIFFSDGESLRRFVAWGMGSFSRVTMTELPLFLIAFIIGFVPLLFLLKYLNLAPYGEQFAKEHGVSVVSCRRLALFCASFLAASVTAFCGPIAFLGLAVPHLAYGIFRSNDHRVLFPATALLGAGLALVASLFPQIPLQTLMSVIGAPTVLWILIFSRHSKNEF